MKIDSVPVECTVITEVQALDRIHVFWINLDPGQGYVTVICYGAAWTAYFGGMMGQTIQEFVAGSDVDYLVSKMAYSPTLQQRKRDVAYLERIVRAVIDAARQLKRAA